MRLWRPGDAPFSGFPRLDEVLLSNLKFFFIKRPYWVFVVLVFISVVVARIFYPGTGEEEAGRGFSAFKTSLLYIVDSRSARATW